MKKLTGVFLSFTLFAAVSCATQTVTLVHINDMHSKILPIAKDDTDFGGFARLATIFARLREHSTNMILLNGGDMLTGSAFSLFYKGAFEVDMMNRFGFNASAVGNHEFDYGLSNAVILERMARFPLLCANVTDAHTGARVFTPYMTTNLGGCSTVIIGVTTSDAGVINTEARSNIVIQNEMDAIARLFDELKLDKTNDLVIILSHAGFDVDEAIAKRFPTIDLIVGGHTHTAVFNPRKVNHALILQAGKYTEYVGNMVMSIRRGEIIHYTYDLIRVDTNFAPEPEVASIIEKRNEEINKLMGNPVCRSDVFLDNSDIRNTPVAIGNFVADILQSFASADLTMVNAGSIRSPIPQGTVTVRDVYEMSPFDNMLTLCDVKGSDLLSIFKRGVECRTFGAFMYYSKGVVVQPNPDGSVTATLNGKPIDPEATYRLAANDFLVAGGDDYIELTRSQNVVNTGWNVRDLIMKYLSDLGTIRASDIDSKPRVLVE